MKNWPKSARAAFAAVTAVSVIGFALLFCFFQVRNPAGVYLRAEKLAEQGDYDGAGRLFLSLDEYRDSAEKAEEMRYRKAETLLEEGKLTAAEGIFAELGDYGDSASRILECRYREAALLEKNGDYERAAGTFSETGDYKDSAECAMRCLYQYAEQLLEDGRYEDAEEAFAKTADYEDSGDRILECRYQRAVRMMNDGLIRRAADEFRMLGDYSDSSVMYLECRYRRALELRKDTRHPVQAVAAFRELGSYRDSEDILRELEYEYVRSSFTSSDPLTEKYLSALAEEGYLDSAELYEELYRWVIRITANDDGDDMETDVDRISRDKVLWWHMAVVNGPPNSTITVRCVAVFPDGQQVTTWDGQDSFVFETGSVYHTNTYYVDPESGAAGEMTFSVYDSDGELLCGKTVVLT